MATTSYDSGGAGSLPGGGNPDYSSLATWEAATDNSLSTIEYLDCYDSQVHDDGVAVLGATGLSATVYRCIRSSVSCATPYVGTKTSGARFVNSTAGVFDSYYSMALNEGHARLVNLSVKFTLNSSAGVAAIGLQVDGNKAINCIAYDCLNSGSGGCAGFEYWEDTLCYNCIADNNESSGFITYDAGIPAAICCTAVNNGTYGFNYTSDSTGTTTLVNCYSNNNGTADYDSGWDAGGYCMAGDTTADNVDGSAYVNSTDLESTGTKLLDSDLLATGYTRSIWTLAGRNPYNDITGTADYDFLYDGVSADDLFYNDIAGNPRPLPEVADSRWTPGASQAMDRVKDADGNLIAATRPATRLTYDSGGTSSLPNGLSPDYSNFTTFEAAWDVNLATYGRLTLDCFDSQDHNDNPATFSGATTSATAYRCIRSSPDCVTQFAGTITTGAYVKSTTMGDLFRLGEGYARVEQMSGTCTGSASGNDSSFACTVTGNKIIHCVSWQSKNSGSGNQSGFFIDNDDNVLVYGCIAYDNDRYGFNAENITAGTTTAFIHCTAVENATYGFDLDDFDGQAIAQGCYAEGNTTDDFGTTHWDAVGGYCVSLDATASNVDAVNYTNSTDLDLDASMFITNPNTYGRNPYNDVTAAEDFDSFLYDGSIADPLFYIDITGVLRPDPEVADAEWSAGANQGIAASTFIPQAIWIM